MADYSWLNALATLLGKTAESRAQGQATQAGIDAQNNQGATSRYQALVNANRLQGIEQPQANTNQAIQGTKLSTWQPVSVTHPRANIPTITGGPQMTDELRQYGSDLTKSAILRQMGGNKIDTSTFPSDEELGMKSTKSNGTLDSILGYGSTAAGILGTILPKLTGGAAAGAGAAGTSGVLPSTAISAPGYSTLPGGAATTPTSASSGLRIPIGGGSGNAGASGLTAHGNMAGLERMATIAQLQAFGLGPDPDPNTPDPRTMEPNLRPIDYMRRSAR